LLSSLNAELNPTCKSKLANVNASNVRSHSDECNTETIESEEEVPQNDNTLCENAVDENVQCFTAKFESLDQVFGAHEVFIDKLLRCLDAIKNSNQWESFVAALDRINAWNRLKCKNLRSANYICHLAHFMFAANDESQM
jgi:hypothetical protein